MPAGLAAENRQELAQMRAGGRAAGPGPFENGQGFLNLRLTAGPERLPATYCPSFRTLRPVFVMGRFFMWGRDTQKPPRGAALRLLRGGRINLERARRFERPTLTLARLCSTPELRPHPVGEGGIPIRAGGCKGENYRDAGKARDLLGCVNWGPESTKGRIRRCDPVKTRWSGRGDSNARP